MARTETTRLWTDAVERPIALNSRSPYVLDTHELGRRPGMMCTVRRSVGAPEDLGTAVIGIPSGSDLELNLRLEAVMEGVLVSGSVHGRAVGECVRCLEEVVENLDVQIQELFCYPDRARVAVEDGDEEEIRVLDGDLIDVEPAIRDAVVPALPFRPVCTPDCPGLCPECGAPLAEAGPDHQHEILDSRWADLGRVMFDDTKES